MANGVDSAPSPGHRLDRLGLVVAVGPHRVIGRRRALPWRVPEDVVFFRAMTSGHSLVVGRRTFEEIGQLEGRRLVVVTSRPESIPSATGIHAARSADEAVSIARRTDAMPIVIGGATVYSALLPLVTDLWWTDVSMPDLRPQVGDVVMPEPAWADFDEIWTRDLAASARLRYLRRYVNLR